MHPFRRGNTLVIKNALIVSNNRLWSRFFCCYLAVRTQNLTWNSSSIHFSFFSHEIPCSRGGKRDTHIPERKSDWRSREFLSVAALEPFPCLLAADFVHLNRLFDVRQASCCGKVRYCSLTVSRTIRRSCLGDSFKEPSLFTCRLKRIGRQIGWKCGCSDAPKREK